MIRNRYLNSNAIYKPDYENFHIKASNDAVIQDVSIFAIGYAQHFVSDTGGDQSVTNSNSNFGAKDTPKDLEKVHLVEMMSDILHT